MEAKWRETPTILRLSKTDIAVLDYNLRPHRGTTSPPPPKTCVGVGMAIRGASSYIHSIARAHHRRALKPEYLATVRAHSCKTGHPLHRHHPPHHGPVLVAQPKRSPRRDRDLNNSGDRDHAASHMTRLDETAFTPSSIPPSNHRLRKAGKRSACGARDSRPPPPPPGGLIVRTPIFSTYSRRENVLTYVRQLFARAGSFREISRAWEERWPVRWLPGPSRFVSARSARN